jgi:hypothetical protein
VRDSTTGRPLSSPANGVVRNQPSGELLVISNVASPDPLTITETVGGVPFTAVLAPPPFVATITLVRNAAGVSVGGLDPTGAAGRAVTRNSIARLGQHRAI